MKKYILVVIALLSSQSIIPSAVTGYNWNLSIGCMDIVKGVFSCGCCRRPSIEELQESEDAVTNQETNHAVAIASDVSGGESQQIIPMSVSVEQSHSIPPEEVNTNAPNDLRSNLEELSGLVDGLPGTLKERLFGSVRRTQIREKFDGVVAQVGTIKNELDSKNQEIKRLRDSISDKDAYHKKFVWRVGLFGVGFVAAYLLKSFIQSRYDISLSKKNK